MFTPAKSKKPLSAREAADLLVRLRDPKVSVSEMVRTNLGWKENRVNVLVSEFQHGDEVLVYFPRVQYWEGEGARYVRAETPLPKELIVSEEALAMVILYPHLLGGAAKDYILKTYKENSDVGDRVGKGKISWGEILYLFREEEEIFFVSENLGGKFLEYDNVTFPSNMIEVKGNSLLFTQRGAIELSEIRCRIPHFTGRKPVSSLPVKKLTPEKKAELSRRGEIFNLYVDGTHHSYEGKLTIKTESFTQQFRANGKIMIDCVGLATYKPSLASNMLESGDSAPLIGPTRGVDPSLWWMTPPYLYGYSFTLKLWGRFDLENIKPVTFRSGLLDRVVMSSYQKTRVLKILQGHEKNRGDADIILGKGAGLNFLLNGPPGRGKTLLTEALSETIKKPLYGVSVGELGVTPEEVEERLREILDLMLRWDAVLLLDEADIFLEGRDSQDIVRNAIVGVFLKALEYHQGVIFLTSNRAKNLDPAVLSRISYGISYGEIDIREIWRNLAREEGIEPTEEQLDRISELGSGLNGRESRNILRLAKMLALQEGRDLTFSDLLTGVVERIEFNKTLSS